MIRQKERMTSKERVLATFAFQKVDRVPVNYRTNAGIDARLKAHFGLKKDSNQRLREILGVDFRGIGVHYIGARLHKEIPDRLVDPQWGWRRRWIKHGSGGYWDYCDFPLQDADEEMVAAWPIPTADDFDYSSLVESCKRNEKYALYVGGAGTACVMNTAGFFRGMEQMLVDLAIDEPAGLLLIDRFMELQYRRLERILDKVGKLVDFVWMGEDLGTQIGPLISTELFRRHIRPYHERFINMAKTYNLPVMLHTCGSSSWAYEDYIEMGLKAVDTLQPEAKDMSPQYLKQHFGGRLMFHGAISTTGALSFGTVQDVIKDVKQTLEIMMPGGGYCLAPTHSFQDNTPVENVVAMYETAHKIGRY